MSQGMTEGTSALLIALLILKLLFAWLKSADCKYWNKGIDLVGIGITPTRLTAATTRDPEDTTPDIDEGQAPEEV